MDRISVYFKDKKLGELSIIDNKYVYVCLPQNIENAYQDGYLPVLYGCDKNFISKELHFSLKNLVVDNDHIKNWEETNIKKEDNDFDRLLKIAKLKNTAHDDFFITVD